MPGLLPNLAAAPTSDSLAFEIPHERETQGTFRRNWEKTSKPGK
jgi:hypothetical protein